MHQTRYKSLYQLLGFSLTISITFPCLLCSTQDESYYANCSQAFKCGDPSVLGDLKFPFWGINRGSYCGKPEFELKCVNNTPLIANSAYNLEVISTDPQFHKVTVALADFRNNLCPSVVLNKHRTNTSFLNLNTYTFHIDSTIRILTILYDCPSELRHQLFWSEEYSCSIKNSTVGVHFVTDTVNSSLISKCAGVVILPIQQQTAESLDSKAISLDETLDQGFDMKYFIKEGNTCDSCTGSGGQCGYNWTVNQFTCYCPDNAFPQQCPPFKQARNGKYNACNQKIQCGHLSDIAYPFYDDGTRPEYCGYPGFKLDCLHDGPKINISSLYYYVLSIHESNAIVARIDTWATNCPSTLINADIDHSLYEFTSSDRNITFFYDCIHSISEIPVSCQTIEGSYYMTNKMQSESNLNLSEVCTGNLSLPILKSSEDTIDMSIIDHGLVDLESVFRQGFELRMLADFGLVCECVESGGQCGYNSSSDKFVCYCTDDNSDIKCELNSSRGTILLS